MASERGGGGLAKVSSGPGMRAGGSAHALAPARAVLSEMNDEQSMVRK